MKKKLEGLELFVDKAIPYMLVLLTVIIILEFTRYAEPLHTPIIIADYIIITFFVVDLVFKWRHTRKVVPFIKLYWLDIIAVFPFYLVFRAFLVAREIVAAGETAQKALHEVALLREARLLREAEFLREFRVLREAEAGAKYAREVRLLRGVPRFLRLWKARFYLVHHHIRERSAHLRSHRRS